MRILLSLLVAVGSKGLTTDVVVIGSGIGGLSAAALLSRGGLDVTVCEQHTAIGGCAHGWERKKDGNVYKFDSGPSLFSGCSAPSSNPLRQVLDACDLEMEWKKYDEWTMYMPEGVFSSKCGNLHAFGEELVKVSGDSREREYWQRLVKTNENLASVIGALPPIALRSDRGIAKTAGQYLAGLNAEKFAKFGLLDLPFKKIDPNGPFTNVLKAAQVPESSLCFRWWNFLAFALSGLPADATSAAACSFMLNEFFAPGSSMEVPVGGSAAIAETLASTSTVKTNAQVKQILLNGKKEAYGVVLKDGTEIKANLAVVSNAGAWGTAKLLDPSQVSGKKISFNIDPNMPATPSFMHLHLAFMADANTDQHWTHTPHHIVVNDWNKPVDAPDNLIFISVPSVLDPTTAPSGQHTLHAYLPATESYETWKQLKRTSPEYKALKEERAEPLFNAVERFIPDIRSRLVLPPIIGSPLTHERFTNRFQGTFGPALRAGEPPGFPGHSVPGIPNLYCCGDSTFPGIGVPAVAGSGIAVASSILSPDTHLDILNDMRSRGALPLPK